MKITGIAINVRTSYNDGSYNEWGDNDFFDTIEDAINFLNDVKEWESEDEEE